LVQSDLGPRLSLGSPRDINGLRGCALLRNGVPTSK
jgi:hypothetical protein